MTSSKGDARVACALALWGALGLGCEGTPASTPLAFDAAPAVDDIAFAAPRLLPDGAVVLLDATPPLEDVTVLSELGVPCARGGIAGTICAPNGATPVGGARVRVNTVDCAGDAVRVETFTDSRGRFELRGVAAGEVRVDVTTGSFTASAEVQVRAGGTVLLAGGDGKLCFSPTSVAIAALTGAYDRIEDNLAQLGFAADIYCGAAGAYRPARTLLQDVDALARYRLLFVNCGTGVNLRTDNFENTQIIEHLRSFVRAGGSVYASDLAADFVEQAWPGWVDFELRPAANSEGYTASPCCVCAAPNCDASCVEQTGQTGPRCPQRNELPAECRSPALPVLGRGRVSPAGTLTQGRVVDPELIAALGFEDLPIRFNAPGWIQIAGVSAGTRVLVQGDGRPLMVLFEPEPGGGRVAFTSFHNEAQGDAAIDAILESLILRL